MVNGQNVFVCQAGGITDCIKYKPDQQLCLVCNETAYLKDGVCLKHDTLQRCQVREGAIQNTCKTCEVGSILFKYNTKCVKIPTKIENCLEYDSIQTCFKCRDGYRLDNLRARCILIPADENCLVQVPKNIYDSTDQSAGYIDIYDAKNLTDFIYTCIQCKPGYFLIQKTVTFDTTKQITVNNVTQDHPKKNQNFLVDVCYSYLKPLIDSTYCMTNNVTGLINFSNKGYCQACQKDFYPEFIPTNRHICMDVDYLQSKSSNNYSLDNCRRVTKITGGSYSCNLCIDGYYFNTITNACV